MLGLFAVFTLGQVLTGWHEFNDELTAHADDEGEAGDIQWNFEKFLVSQVGEVVRRFRPMTTPEDPALVSAIEDQLEGK